MDHRNDCMIRPDQTVEAPDCINLWWSNAIIIVLFPPRAMELLNFLYTLESALLLPTTPLDTSMYTPFRALRDGRGRIQCSPCWVSKAGISHPHTMSAVSIQQQGHFLTFGVTLAPAALIKFLLGLTVP